MPGRFIRVNLYTNQLLSISTLFRYIPRQNVALFLVTVTNKGLSVVFGSDPRAVEVSNGASPEKSA